nr:uncharacterized protein LOC109167502 [Ipomoea batatas]
MGGGTVPSTTYTQTDIIGTGATANEHVSSVCTALPTESGSGTDISLNKLQPLKHKLGYLGLFIVNSSCHKEGLALLWKEVGVQAMGGGTVPSTTYTQTGIDGTGATANEHVSSVCTALPTESGSGTDISTNKLQPLKHKLGYLGLFIVNSSCHKGGLALLWKEANTGDQLLFVRPWLLLVAAVSRFIHGCCCSSELRSPFMAGS